MHPYITEQLAAEHRKDMLKATHRDGMRTYRAAATPLETRRRRFAHLLRCAVESLRRLYPCRGGRVVSVEP
jgi:hypothetical protein